jgi:hypothetical protein
MEAGKLLENLPILWEEADLAERRNLLMAMRQRFFNYRDNPLKRLRNR